ncbi:tRNA1(Val) (adenine(37)-N6)-methyltransferase [Necropsobacter massiliensis]|uniref:tRNA1(Val) (adenine(37)-N6)-methyltransferase n=1 Tax=Necropsobacter massiliensis TaxID=1400001 RepID=UPI000595BC56|nr:tRNA1(Val) (adenine(37)-N6)-methyltransferase [Necropsobacter massiliensis]
MTAKNHGFTFKQFHINHDRCAMKVGTDGVLLGAWADVSDAKTLLDLGTGTGLIALMLAQRTAAHCRISAVEIDDAAFLQAKENVRHSPWADRISIYHQDIADFAAKCGEKFDIITANPPYFQPGSDCRSGQRSRARYMLDQCHADWLNLAAACLNDNGRIHFILPFEAGETLQKQTALFCLHRCEVVTKTGKMPQRLLLTFAKQPQPTVHERLTIYDENHHYQPEFIRLIQDFYLKY